ncbi:MAG: hypothetical protein U0270_05325 [Labilithrix sp.]
MSAATAALVVACSINEVHFEEIEVTQRPLRETITCDSSFVAVDLDARKPCGSKERGAGHCYDGSKVPIVLSQLEQLGVCEGEEYCVPDKVLSARGSKLKSCTFPLTGGPGACGSLLLKDIYANKDLLRPKPNPECAEDEVCLPCVDPRNGKDTGMCNDFGAHQADCIEATGERPASCCHLMGECVNEEAVPEQARATAIKDSCKDGQLCAPTAQLDNKPVSCDYLGARGVCLDRCFAEQLVGLSRLSRGGCRTLEVCVPCAITNTLGGDLKMAGCL